MTRMIQIQDSNRPSGPLEIQPPAVMYPLTAASLAHLYQNEALGPGGGFAFHQFCEFQHRLVYGCEHREVRVGGRASGRSLPK